MAKCPVCGRRMLKKTTVPNEEINGRYIDVLQPMEICEKCSVRLRTLVSETGYSLPSARESARQYFQRYIPEIQDENTAAVLDLYVNNEEKNIEKSLVKTTSEEYMKKIEEYRSFYHDMDHVYTPSGAFGVKDSICYYSPYKEIQDPEAYFTENTRAVFDRKINEYSADNDDNILAYAIKETKSELLGDGAETVSISKDAIEYYREEPDGIRVVYTGDNNDKSEYTVPSECIAAFEQLIPEKEYSLCDKIIAGFELEESNEGEMLPADESEKQDGVTEESPESEDMPVFADIVAEAGLPAEDNDSSGDIMKDEICPGELPAFEEVVAEADSVWKDPAEESEKAETLPSEVVLLAGLSEHNDTNVEADDVSGISDRVLDNLRKLRVLLDEGTINYEEFTILKKQMLGIY